MRLKVVTPPAEEPVTLDEAKAHLRLEISNDDVMLARLIRAARALCEAEIDRSFVTTAWRLRLDRFPSLFDASLLANESPFSTRWVERGSSVGTLLPIRVPRADLIAVSSITYVDAVGSTLTLDPSLYIAVPGAPGEIYPAYGRAWPTARDQPTAVLVDFTAGYGDADDVPDVVKQAILLMVAYLYENREAASDTASGGSLKELPIGVCDLLAAESWGSYW